MLLYSLLTQENDGDEKEILKRSLNVGDMMSSRKVGFRILVSTRT